MSKNRTEQTGHHLAVIQGVVGVQGIQSTLSDQSCPSTTDWYTGIQGILGIQRIQGQFLGK